MNYLYYIDINYFNNLTTIKGNAYLIVRRRKTREVVVCKPVSLATAEKLLDKLERAGWPRRTTPNRFDPSIIEVECENQ